MTTERLELPDGQWADLLVKPRHEEYLAISEAHELALRGESTMVRWALEVGRQFCKKWLVKDEDGQAVDISDWSLVDPDITDAICTEAQNRWRDWSRQRRPLVRSGRRFAATSPEQPSKSPTE